MQAISFDFRIPRSWAELTDKHLRYLYRLISSNLATEEIQLLCLLRWSNVKVIGRHPSGAYLLKHKKDLFEVTATAIAELLPHLQWLAELPDRPIRPERLHKTQALPPTLSGAPFELYLAIENLYQGYLTTQNEQLLDALAELLYPNVKTPLPPPDRIAVFYWVASIKAYLATRFPDLFHPTATDDSNLLGQSAPSVEASMNAQIRALTKGDITKEREILSLDMDRALTELNAQAHEYNQLKTKP